MNIKQHLDYPFQQLVLDLTQRYGVEEATSIAKILFEDVFGTKNAITRLLSTTEHSLFLTLKERLINGEPIQYVTGVADFFGLKFKVTPSVLIPRCETEELVDLCLKHLKKINKQSITVLDIGTGSGCIPITIKKKMPYLTVFACDISAAALEIASENAKQNNTEIHWICADILDESTWDSFPTFDLIVSNPPYITFDEKKLMPEHVLEHEPGLALFVPNEKPLLFYEKIARFGKNKINSGGKLYFECNEFYTDEISLLLTNLSYNSVINTVDIFNKPRFSEGII
jgi:release factor glutamine methyltransferase